MTKWQYKTIDIVPANRGYLYPEEIDQALNEHGRDGWELVALDHRGAGAARATFKRSSGFSDSSPADS